MQDVVDIPHDNLSIDHLLREAEESESFRIKRGIFDVLERRRIYMNPQQQKWFDVLKAEFRDRMHYVLGNRMTR